VKWLTKLIDKIVGTYYEPPKKPKVIRVGDLEYKTKKELETIGRKIGLELDRRLSKQKLINKIKFRVKNKR
tara:strand:+ start:2892 stop:3104 length:213 start_codon:yes stop_codon:yes gene_type:complete